MSGGVNAHVRRSTLVHGPGEFGGLGVTEEAGAAGIGVALFETHPVDVTRHLLRARGIKKIKTQSKIKKSVFVSFF